MYAPLTLCPKPFSRLHAVRRFFLGALLILGAASLPLSPSARAQSGRGFPGFYSFTELADSPGSISLTLNLRLFNNSGADLTSATITLHDSSLPRTVYGQLPGVTLPAGQSAVFSKRISVPRREYQVWRQGRHPNLMIEFTDLAGHKVRRALQLLPGPVGGS